MTPINDSEIHTQQKHQLNFMNNDEEDENNSIYNRMPQQMQSQFQPHQPQIYPFEHENKKDVFANIDKTSYIIIFIAFILGFFMGKTMQPVILRHG